MLLKCFMPPRAAPRFDEKRPPLDKGGLQGGFEGGKKPTPALRATPPTEGIFKGAVHPECYASIFFTTLPATSVSRNSRPICL